MTPLGKAILVLLGVAIIYFGLRNFAPDIKKWAIGQRTEKTAAAGGGDVTPTDFGALKNAPPDPERGKGSEGVAASSQIAGGKLSRPLVVAINTWAGHAPGIVYNGGLDPNPASLYKKNFGLDVKFVLLEDPAAKLAAFRNG